jgi:hypothetical protein
MNLLDLEFPFGCAAQVSDTAVPKQNSAFYDEVSINFRRQGNDYYLSWLMTANHNLERTSFWAGVRWPYEDGAWTPRWYADLTAKACVVKLSVDLWLFCWKLETNKSAWTKQLSA